MNIIIKPGSQQVFNDKQDDQDMFEHHINLGQLGIYFVNQQKNTQQNQANHKNIKV
jgi:hypothetical protein